MLQDTSAVKPEEWDEDAPRMIPDPEAQMPEVRSCGPVSLLVISHPSIVSAPSKSLVMLLSRFSLQCQAWDEDEDGEWEAPAILNPKCATSGCGPWERPNKKNDKYKGKFVPRQIPNPDYKVGIVSLSR